MAAYAARAGLRSIVFIPEGKIAWGKLSQSMDYGALTIQLKTDFDGCVSILTELVRRFPDLPAQLRQSLPPRRPEDPRLRDSSSRWSGRFPSTSSSPAAISPTRSALAKGFAEMHHLGLIPRVPKISIIQAEGANPLYRWPSGQQRRRAEAGRRPTPAPPPSASATRPPGARPPRIIDDHRRLVRAGLRAGDRPRQGRDRRRRRRLRTCLRRYPRRPQKARRPGQDHPRKSASSSSSPATPSRTRNYTIDYHRNELFTDAENAQISRPQTGPPRRPA